MGSAARQAVAEGDSFASLQQSGDLASASSAAGAGTGTGTNSAASSTRDESPMQPNRARNDASHGSRSPELVAGTMQELQASESSQQAEIAMALRSLEHSRSSQRTRSSTLVPRSRRRVGPITAKAQQARVKVGGLQADAAQRGSP